MAFTYQWSQLVSLVSAQVKNIPVATPLGVMQCDFVSSKIAGKFPWKPQITTFEDGFCVLQNGVQDYDPPLNIWRLNEAWLVETDVTPYNTVNIDVLDSLAIDLIPRSPYNIQAVSLEAGVGKLRLECAAYIAAPNTWQLQGKYQINPTKIVSLNQGLWMDDHYAYVALEGLTYWAYKLADDPRGDSQLVKFEAAIEEMRRAEDAGGDNQFFPTEALGVGRSQGYPNIYGV